MQKNPQGLSKIFGFDRCRRYFPRYDEQKFLEQVTYTEGQLISYFPRRFVEQYDEFKRAGHILKAGFWVIDIAFVSLCHRIKILTKLLGNQTWRMFTFKIACIAFPLIFLERVEQDAKDQFNKQLYKGVYKFYKRYKQTGDILHLNINIELEQSQTQLQKICHLNEFNLVHGLSSRNINESEAKSS